MFLISLTGKSPPRGKAVRVDTTLSWAGWRHPVGLGVYFNSMGVCLGIRKEHHMKKLQWRYLAVIGLLLYSVSAPSTTWAVTATEAALHFFKFDTITLYKVTSVRTVVGSPVLPLILVTVTGRVGSVAPVFPTISAGDTVVLVFEYAAAGDRAQVNHCRDAAIRTMDHPGKSRFGVGETPQTIFPPTHPSAQVPNGQQGLATVTTVLYGGSGGWVCNNVKP